MCKSRGGGRRHFRPASPDNSKPTAALDAGRARTKGFRHAGTGRFTKFTATSGSGMGRRLVPQPAPGRKQGTRARPVEGWSSRRVGLDETTREDRHISPVQDETEESVETLEVEGDGVDDTDAAPEAGDAGEPGDGQAAEGERG